MSDCIFCKIANGEIPTTTVYENDLVRAFRDTDPQAPTHVLVVPKRHIQSVNQLTQEDGELMLAMLDAIHATVLELARDVARLGKAFEGLLKRYFG